MIRHWYHKSKFITPPMPPSLILHPKLHTYPLSNYNNKSKHAAQFASLLSQNLQPQELHSVATTVNNCVHRDILAAVAVAGAECAKLVETKNSTMNAAPNRVELLSEFSKIKTMAEFAQFDDGGGEAFERTVALGIAAGFGDRVVCCAIERKLEFKRDAKLLANSWSRSQRARATKDIDALLDHIRFQLQQSVTSSFVLVNAPRAAFADLIVCGSEVVACVQCKSIALQHIDSSAANHEWAKMGSHGSNSSRRFLDRLISKVYDDPSKVKKQFVMVVRAGKWAHLWPRWFQRFAQPDRHLFIIRPSTSTSNKADQQPRFEVEIHHGREAPIKHLPSPINFLALMRSVNKQHLQLARTLIENSEPETLRWLSNHLTHQVKQSLLSALAEVGVEIAKLAGTAKAAYEQQNEGVEILSEHSKIKTLAGFSQIGGDSDSFERAVALAIASGVDGRGVVCAVERRLEFQVAEHRLSRRQQFERRHIDRSIDDLLAQVKFQLEHAAPCTFVLVNGSAAAFADIMALGRESIVLVQAKEHMTCPMFSNRSAQEWRKMGSHSSNNSRRFLDRLISKVYDDPRTVKKHFVMVVRAGRFAHLWPRWFTHSLRRHRTNNDHHFFLVRPDKGEKFRVEKFTK